MERETKKTVIKFDEIREKVFHEISERIKNKKIEIDEPVHLVDGFVRGPLSMELSSSVTLGGPSVPMVMLLGSNSGRVYFFALKALLQDIGL